LIRAPDGQRLWAAEQALRSHGCGAVLSWPGTLTVPQVRRLQLASERGGGLGLVFRPAVEAGLASPAALRLLVRPEGDALRVKVLKRPGGWAGEEVRIAC
jgi:hypothetical protein